MKKIQHLASFFETMSKFVSNSTTIDARIMVLYFHLYMEHYVNAICQIKEIKEKNLGKRVKSLNELKVIPNDAYDLICLIIDLRNKLMHELIVEKSDVENRLKNMTPLFKTTDPDLLEYLNRIDVWQEFHTYTCALIRSLYMTVCELLKIQPLYDLRPSVFLGKDKVRMQIVLLKRVGNEFVVDNSTKKFNSKFENSNI